MCLVASEVTGKKPEGPKGFSGFSVPRPLSQESGSAGQERRAFSWFFDPAAGADRRRLTSRPFQNRLNDEFPEVDGNRARVYHSPGTLSIPGVAPVIAAIIININPILVQLGPLAIRWYGLMYVVGIIVGVRAALPYVEARGITEDQVWNVIGPSIVAGLVGGRLYYVVQQPLGPFIAQPWRIIATWEGGMAFFGAIAAVVVTLAITCWREKMPFWVLLDGAAILATVGQAFGRVGNIINGDILGAPTSLAWGFIYANPNSFAPSHTIPYQPAAVYELLCDLLLLGVLWGLRDRLKIPGLLATLYFLGYAVTQFLVFFLRDSEPVVQFGLKQAQLTSIVVFVVAIALGVWRIRAARRESPGISGDSASGPDETSSSSMPVGDTA